MLAALSTALLLSTSAPDWQPWSDATFERAAAEERLIVAHIGTTWCHWCHVMDDETWADLEVQAILKLGFVAIRVDADARPDLQERYRDWGWPALVLMTPGGEAIRNFRGYRSPAKMKSILGALLAKKTAGQPLVVERKRKTRIAPEGDVVELAIAQLDKAYDPKIGGWGGPKKYPRWAPIELALQRAELDKVTMTLDATLALVDDKAGGLYQYSTRNDWQHPHTEKLAFMQGWGLKMFSAGYRATGDARYLDAARAIARYLDETMRSPSGALYANQNADLDFYTSDRNRPAPSIDKSLYAAHNGEILSGLCALELAAPRASQRAAIAAAYDDIRARTLGEDGLYRHQEKNDARVYLLDQVAMAEAELALAQCGALDTHRERLLALLAATDRLFDKSKSQYLSTDSPRARTPFRENARLARVLYRAALLTGVAPDRARELKDRARLVVDTLRDPARVAGEGRAVGPFVLAARDLKEEPVHIAVVGKASRALFEAAARLDLPSRIVEHMETSARFPDLGKPAAFVCSSTRCSRPIFDEERLKPEIARFLAPG